MTGVVVIGAGQAGAQVAMSLRERGYTSSITIVGDEAHAPYHRPPLSKGYMAGDAGEDELPIRAEDFYREGRIDLLTGVPVTKIERESQHVLLAGGRRIPYGHLILATGARSRKLSHDDQEPPNVHYLRTREDAARLKNALPDAHNVMIIGAGFIGLEFASLSAALGKQTTVVETASRVMARAVSPLTSAYYTERHRGLGTRVHCDATVRDLLRNSAGIVTHARIGDSLHPVDLVVVGIGVVPNAELAENAGLDTDDGIVVDATLATSDPAISAIGDCARHPRPECQQRVRVESVQNAADQARFLSLRLTSGATAYEEVPWFWSRQGGDKLQIAGLAMPTDDSILLGSPETGRFSVARIRDGVLVAVESTNNPGDYLATRKLLGAGVPVPDAGLRTSGFSLREAAVSARSRHVATPV